MKKRLMYPLLLLLAITSILLVVTIFKLYTEAEKVQKNIFSGNIIVAGEDIVNKIYAVLKGDTSLLETYEINTLLINETPAIQEAKHFLLDSNSIPVAIINKVISYNEKNIFTTQYDTLYFDTNYRHQFPFLPVDWNENFDPSKFEDKRGDGRKNRYKMDINLIEMDSNTLRILNKDFLNRIIKESLREIKEKYDYDFALYNAFTTQFVIPPSKTLPDKILKSEYVFMLKKNDRFIAPHYLILYFPMERGIYFQMMGAIAGMILVLLGSILLISSFTIIFSRRQKKNTDVRNDFINNMTHEFKTPISTISLACEAISDESIINDHAARSEYFSIIKDENERLKNMVTNILQLAQLKKGQMKMNIEKVNVHQVIKSVVNSVALQVNTKNGVLTTRLNAQNPYIFADKTHIENCIINLVENAIKYSKDNNVEIEIDTKNDKRMFVLSIKDNGIGISKKNARKIFNEFYRVTKGNVHDNKGFGMGLDYVKKIVSLHGGSIHVKSEINKGSIFTVSLPNKKM
ncbi:MAG: HAMP domain-containing histidine kinase [Bacteroidales bacterium]|jgi:two-component system phosphate regulon sensor histidine kinase PhoR|nr:HAMP domain-containing histidine kinase [Bacteroidales bacterium]